MTSNGNFAQARNQTIAEAVKAREYTENLLERLSNVTVTTGYDDIQPVPHGRILGSTITSDDTKQIISRLTTTSSSSKVITFVQSVKRDPLDPRIPTKKSLATASMTTNHMDFPILSVDRDIFHSIKNWACERTQTASHPEHDLHQQYCHALAQVARFQGCGGSLKGLLERLVTGSLESQLPDPLEAEDYDLFALYAKRVLVFRPVVHNWHDTQPANLFDLVKVNPYADAGSPYFCKTNPSPRPNKMNQIPRAALGEALGVLGDLWKAICDSPRAYNKWKVDNPARSLVLLKNKVDIYEWSKIYQKTRPIFVYPLHWRILASMLWLDVKPVPFFEGSESEVLATPSSSRGFSWAHGGGDVIYNTVLETERQRFLLYSDDGLWIFNVLLADGTVEKRIYTPDFNHLDISLKDWVAEVAKRVFPICAPGVLPRSWAMALHLHMQSLFHKVVVVEGALTVKFDEMLASGGVGTTDMDELAAAVVVGSLDFALSLGPRGPIPIATLERELAKVEDFAKTLGLTFKGDSIKDYYVFKPDLDEYKFVFLGYRLVKQLGTDGQHYVPCPDLERLMVVAVHQRHQTTGLNPVRSRMDKLRSLAVQGAYLFPALYHAMKVVYNGYRAGKYHPASSVMEVEFGGEHAPEVKFLDDEFPTREFCLGVWLPQGTQPTVYIDKLEDLEEVAVEDDSLAQFEASVWADDTSGVVPPYQGAPGFIAPPSTPLPVFQAAKPFAPGFVNRPPTNKPSLLSDAVPLVSVSTPTTAAQAGNPPKRSDAELTAIAERRKAKLARREMMKAVKAQSSGQALSEREQAMVDDAREGMFVEDQFEGMQERFEMEVEETRRHVREEIAEQAMQDIEARQVLKRSRIDHDSDPNGSDSDL